MIRKYLNELVLPAVILGVCIVYSQAKQQRVDQCYHDMRYGAEYMLRYGVHEHRRRVKECKEVLE